MTVNNYPSLVDQTIDRLVHKYVKATKCGFRNSPEVYSHLLKKYHGVDVNYLPMSLWNSCSIK